MATKDGQTYNVAFEQGGFVTMWHIWQFVVDTGGKVISDHEIVPDRQKGSASHGGSKTPR